MKIVYCIQGVYNSGGMERVLANKANYLADIMGMDVYIVTTDQKGRPLVFDFSPKIKLIDLGINYENNSQKNIFFKVISQFFNLIRHRRKLSRCLKQIKPDITISMFGMEMPFLHTIHDGSKKILEFHFSKYYKIINSHSAMNKIFQRVRLKIWGKKIKEYDAFVALTERDLIEWNKPINGIAIPNMIPSKQLNDNPGLKLTQKTVMAAGRLTYQKGFDMLIDAWIKIHQNYPDWKLIIYGDGDLRDVLQQKIDRNNLSNNIKLFGNVLSLSNYFDKADFFVLSSRYEGLPMVILEAMANRLPCIAFDCQCGPSDIITNKVDGILVEAGNVDQLSNEIINLIEDENLRQVLSSNIPKKMIYFSEESIMNRWMDLFNRVVS